jgi:hypothetical protein
VSSNANRYNFSSVRKLQGTAGNFFPLMDQCEGAGSDGNENSNVINQSNKNPGLKIISKQVMRAVQQNGFTTYKEVANVVS